jgi:DNA-binding HxlR family transcriptional regulator
MVRHGLSQDIQTWLPYCPYYAAASEILSRRWAATVLRALIPGPARFGEIASAIPDMTDKLLSQRLKDLFVEVRKPNLGHRQRSAAIRTKYQ